MPAVNNKKDDILTLLTNNQSLKDEDLLEMRRYIGCWIRENYSVLQEKLENASHDSQDNGVD